MATCVCCVLHAELARGSPGSIDHLRIVGVSLRVDLVAQVFLVNILIGIPLASDCVHHIRSCTYVWPVAALERF